MNKKTFINMMEAVKAFDKELKRWDDFGIDVFELPIGQIPWNMFDYWTDSNFTEEGVDWINWYLWERVDIFNDEILPCYDENNNKFYINNLDDLWELVKKYVK